jgi:hypothetical protein
MNVRTAAFFACLTATCLPGCSADPDAEQMAQLGPTAQPFPPPEISIELPLEQKKKPRDPGTAQACLLGASKSCAELDPRAFEPCLVGAKSCNDEGEGGIMPLEAPVVDYPAPHPR